MNILRYPANPTWIFVLFTIFSITIQNSSAQNLKESVSEKALDWQKKLFLNFDQTRNLEEVLLWFDENYKKLILEEYDEQAPFAEKYAKLKTNRNQKLSRILDEQQMIVLKSLEDNRIRQIKDFYESTLPVFSQDAAFIEELTAFNHNMMWPVIRSYRTRFNKVIKQEDQSQLGTLSDTFSQMLDQFISETNTAYELTTQSDIDKAIQEIARFNPENKSTIKKIKSLNRIYRKELKFTLQDLASIQAGWRNSLQVIFEKHLPAAQKKELDELFRLLGVYGVQHKINQWIFMLIDPEAEEEYFSMNRKFHTLFFRALLK